MGTSSTANKCPAIAVTSIRIERERLDAFKAVAEANRRSVSQEMRWLIDRHIAEAKAEAA